MRGTGRDTWDRVGRGIGRGYWEKVRGTGRWELEWGGRVAGEALEVALVMYWKRPLGGLGRWLWRRWRGERRGLGGSWKDAVVWGEGLDWDGNEHGKVLGY